MMRRLHHLVDSQRWHTALWERTKSWAPELCRHPWQSWVRHPFANVRHAFWNHTPHLPRWEVNESSMGSVDHERATADILFIADRCSRCGMHTNESRWVPDTDPKDAA